MSNTRYIEIDSTYRNRKEWPLPGEFEILFGQSGRKNKADAVDPVSNAAVITRWTSNAFNTTGPTAVVSGSVIAIDAPGLGSAGDNATVIEIIAIAGNTYQQIENYYINAVASDTTGTLGYSRIIGYKYLGTSGGLGRIQIVVNGFNSLATGDTIEINDPTDVISDPSFPRIFVPNGRLGTNAYPNYILYNETRSIATGIPEYRIVSNYDFSTHLLELDTSAVVSTATSGPLVGWANTDVLILRNEPPIIGILNNNIASTSVFSLPTSFTDEQNAYRNSFIRMTSGATIGETQRIVRYETLTGNAVSGTLTTVVFPVNASNIHGFYNGAYIQVLTGAASGNIRQVTNYTVTGSGVNTIRTITVNAAFTGVVATGDSFTFRSGFVSPDLSNSVATGDTFEILQFSHDNLNPLLYSGSLVSQQEMVCYEIELINLSLPNKTLDTGFGSRIAFYPYVYVELSNVSGAGAGLKNTIYSNNPNSTRMTFRADITDISNPIISAFVNVNGRGMKQTLKFKPNDNLRFSVHLSNGFIYRTLETEDFGPLPPNLAIQVSALFGIRRIT